VVVVRFNEALLRQQSSGRNTLVSRLVAVIQVTNNNCLQTIVHGISGWL
jgi:hypothetical protein